MSGRTGMGGLGRGLGALIPTAPPRPTADAPADTAPDGAAARTTDRQGTATGTAVMNRPASDAFWTALDQPADGTADLAPVEGASFAELPVDEIHPNAKQPRQVFDEDALHELTHSIRAFGVLQPVVVRADPAGGYELVMGERRLRAAAAAGLTHIPAIVRTNADDAMLRDALLENIHRAQLNPLEEANAYQQLLEEFGATHEELAHRIGRSRPHISNTIRLLNLSLPVQRRVAAGVLSAGHARALLGLDDQDAQDELAARIVAEGLSVRATEELVALAQRGHGASRPARRGAGTRLDVPGSEEIAERLSDVFETRVRVELGRSKGRITVEFASAEDLQRILAVMQPGSTASPAQG
ncbi:MAG: ParB/RepB/Spo0J family partition protein [Jatrophihabitans sp.]|uniref:ParB/RepB/Spo0J family partition protein n=1 Tax=Jatrophihabitans sp. TaxID=1932789 RepID=UPI003F7FC9A3